MRCWLEGPGLANSSGWNLAPLPFPFTPQINAPLAGPRSLGPGHLPYSLSSHFFFHDVLSLQSCFLLFLSQPAHTQLLIKG